MLATPVHQRTNLAGAAAAPVTCLLDTPDKDACVGIIIVAEDGLLPMGKHTWRAWVNGKWKDQIMTTTLVADKV